MIRILIAVFTIAFALEVNAAATRKNSARVHFVRAHACPATGLNKLPCKGYVIDHVIPLACGGADDPSNMQWQTVAEGKAKDKWERKGCQTTKGRD